MIRATKLQKNIYCLLFSANIGVKIPLVFFCRKYTIIKFRFKNIIYICRPKKEN